MIGDGFRDHWEPRMPQWYPPASPGGPHVWDGNPKGVTTVGAPQITRKEFEDLKKEVELLADLLKRAIKYDEANNEPHCETDEKMALLRAVAKAVGVDLPL